MAFSKRKQDRRKSDARPLAASAEICETRALLSADGACVPVDEFVETAAEETESVQYLEDGVIAEDGELIPEFAICTMAPIDLEFTEVVEDSADGEEVFRTCGTVVDGEIFDGEVEILEGEEIVDIATLGDFDPSWIYFSFSASEENVEPEVIDEKAEFTGEEVKVFKGETEEEVVSAEVEEEFVDITTLEDWDPAWAYRGTVVDGEEVTEVVDETDAEVTWEGWQDGLGCGIAVDGFVPEGEEAVLYTFDGVADEEVTEELIEVTEGEEVVELTGEEKVDSPAEGETEEVDPVRYFGGPNFRGGDDAEILMMSSSNSPGGSISESGPVVFGPFVDAGSQVPAVVSTPVVNQSVAVPVIGLAVQPVSLSIPVAQSFVSSLFNNEDEFSGVETLVSAVDYSVESSVTSEIDSAAPVLDAGLQSLFSTSEESDNGNIGELVPLLESEEESEEPVTVPETEEVAVEVEESVSAVRSYENESVAVVSQNQALVASLPVVKRDRSSRAIDRFMSDFAMNGFAG